MEYFLRELSVAATRLKYQSQLLFLPNLRRYAANVGA
jgi:hypothetical protein